MSNANRDYAIVYDVKNSSLVLSRPLVFYITDKNTSNIFVRLVTRIIIGNGIDQYTDIENASNYILTMRVIKPNDEIKSIQATQHEPESLFQFDLTEDFKDIPGKYICELIISTIVNGRQELITSDAFNYEVKRSILSKVNVIEGEGTTVEKLLNDLDATKAKFSSQIKDITTDVEKKAYSSEVVGKNDYININQIPAKSITQAKLSDDLLQMMAGNTPINAVPADNSITYKKLSKEVQNILEKNNAKVLANVSEIKKDGFNYVISTSDKIQIIRDNGDRWGFEQLSNYILENDTALVADINRDPGTGYTFETLPLSNVGLITKKIVVAYCYYGRLYGLSMPIVDMFNAKITADNTKIIADNFNVVIHGSINKLSKSDVKFNISTGRIVLSKNGNNWKFNGLTDYALDTFSILVADISKTPNNTDNYDLTKLDIRNDVLTPNQIPIIGNYYGELSTKLTFLPSSQKEKYDMMIYRTEEDTYIYKNYNDKYIRYNFKKINDTNMHYNCVRMYDITVYDESFNTIYNIVTNAEWECAIHEDGALDFIGGFHGDEIAKNTIYLVNGIKDDNMYNKITKIDSFSLLVNSDLYRCNSNEIVAERQKEIKITDDGLIIKNKIKWKKSITLDKSELGMLSVKRNDSGYNLSKYAFCDLDYKVESISTTAEIYNRRKGIRKATMYSDNISFTLESKCNPLLPNNNFQCVYYEDSGLNKFYFDFSGSYTTTVDEVWEHEGIYTIQPK